MVPNKVMRVRGSAGLKLPSEFNEKGSLRIETDSSTTARVEVDETLNTAGPALGAAETERNPPPNITAKLAHQRKPKRLRKAKAPLLIGFLSSQSDEWYKNED